MIAAIFGAIACLIANLIAGAVVQRAFKILIGGKADHDAYRRRHRDAQQDTGKAEQGAADHEREDDPNRVQPDLIADEFRREKHGFQYLG